MRVGECAELFCPLAMYRHVVRSEPIKINDWVCHVGRARPCARMDKPRSGPSGMEATLNLDNNTIFTPSYWDAEAYTKAWEKFEYGTPRVMTDSEKHTMWEVLYAEYDYMYGTRVIPWTSTEKKHDSHPGYPARFVHVTETDLIEAEGFVPYAHFEEHLPSDKHYYWYMFPKSEQLKRTKVKDSDVRMIQCAPAQVTRFAARFETEPNRLMKEHTFSREAKVGWSPLFGGLDRYLRAFTGCHTFMEMDWTRYDGTIPNGIFKAVSEFRVTCVDCEDSLKGKYEWYRDSLLHRNTLSSDGDVHIITRGNPSGQFSTSADNCMVQTILVCLETAAWLEELGHSPTFEEIRGCYVSMSYGDDRITGYTDTYHGKLCPPDGKWLSSYYKQTHGMWVKPENIIIQHSLIGLTFCGMTIAEKGGRYVPQYKSEKIFANIAHPVRPSENLVDMTAKLDSALVLTSYNDDAFSRKIRAAASLAARIYPYTPIVDKTAKLMMGGPNFNDRHGSKKHKTQAAANPKTTEGGNTRSPVKGNNREKRKQRKQENPPTNGATSTATKAETHKNGGSTPG